MRLHSAAAIALVTLGLPFVPGGTRTYASGQIAALSTRDDDRDDSDGRQRLERLLLQGHPPSLGMADAPLTIVVFQDFACPFCKQVHEVLERKILPSHKTTVRIVYRAFPLPQHPWSRLAADVAACVNRQDKNAFWAVSDFMYEHQESLNTSLLKLDVLRSLEGSSITGSAKLKRCIDQGESHDAVQDDIELADSLGVHSTPAVFLNGRMLFGRHDIKQFEEELQIEAKTTKQEAEGIGRQ